MTVLPGGPRSLGLLGCCRLIPGTCLRGRFTSGGSSHCVHVVHWGIVSLQFPASLKCRGIQNPCVMLDAATLLMETYHPGPFFFGISPLQSLFTSDLGKPLFLLGWWRLRKEIIFLFCLSQTLGWPWLSFS